MLIVPQEALDFKLDLRITVGIEQEQNEVATAELAKSKSTTESKLYNHKLKMALVTKFLYKGVFGSLIVIDCTVNQEHSGCQFTEGSRQEFDHNRRDSRRPGFSLGTVPNQTNLA
ncbi:uncharacterized protein EV154DRAFT_482813 [Mucor mucedo]|uniref:uncharacterized protein n=1 Tax=Mucor mucedo TaxID=29922 RepID=UPI0022206BC9|nr:uncharacterized protein EV154DRAFT_482813 [Mucor mucedo]KAI7889799.1 hypothetical protein EV154DRAFT_482813 [Mucor mucedo]